MGMNPRGRSRGRNHNNFNNNRRFNNQPNRNTVYDSIGPAGRLRGTAFQLMEKYLSAAKELMSSDRVLAENCLQHADHYSRLNALAIAAEGARFAQQTQQVETAQNSGDDIEREERAVDDAREIEAEAPVEQLAAPAFVPAAVEEDEQPAVSEPSEQVDLSVPVAAMAQNEMKRRGRPPMKRPAASVSGDAPAQPRRRGRPPMKKSADAQA